MKIEIVSEFVGKWLDQLERCRQPPRDFLSIATARFSVTIGDGSHPLEGAIQQRDLLPSPSPRRSTRCACSAAIAACAWYGPGRAMPDRLLDQRLTPRRSAYGSTSDRSCSSRSTITAVGIQPRWRRARMLQEHQQRRRRDEALAQWGKETAAVAPRQIASSHCGARAAIFASRPRISSR